MARLPNRQFGVGGTVTADPLAPAPPSRGEVLEQNLQFAKDAFDHSSVARFGRAVEVEAQGWRPATVDFDPAKHIPQGYEAEGEAFMRADGPDQIELIRRQVDANRALQKRRLGYSSATLLAGDLLAESANPLNYLPVPSAAGSGFVVGALKVGGANAISAAGQEAVLAQDGTTSVDESLWNVGTAAAFGGILGGTVGHLTARNVVGPARTITRMPAPVAGARYGSRFGPRAAPETAMGRGSSNHKGVDIKGRIGDPVRVPMEGTVIKAKMGDGPNGNTVTIDHGHGVVTKYLHLSQFDVRVGQRVLPNQLFAKIGTSGRSTGPHLHWQMEINGKAVDPLTTRLPEGMGGEGSPAHAVDASVGAVVPDMVDLPDGRAVPVVFGKTGNGAVASFRRSKATGELVDEVTGLGDVDQPVTRLAPEGEDVAPDRPGIDFDRLINPEERFSNGRPLSKTALLGRFDDRLTAAEAAARRGSKAHEPEWLAEQRALVEAAYGEPDRPLPSNDPSVLAAQRRAEAGPKAGRHAPSEAESGLDEVLTDPTQLRSRKLMARAEGLYQWAKDGLALHGTKEAYRPKPKLPEHHPDHKPARPYSKAYLTEMMERGRAAMQDAEDALDEATHRDSAPDTNPVDAPLDEGLAEIRAQDRDKRAQDFDSGELADDLPFGRDHVGDAASGLDGDHIVFDMKAAIRSYASKPWTQSHIEGVDGLPEDAFPTMKDWVDFVMLHEIEHSYNPQRAGESTAAYENRIVARAVEQLKARKGAAVPEGGKLRLATLAGSPIKDVIDLVGDSEARIHASIQQLGSDGAMFLESNAAGGTPIAPGGSVFQRSHMRLREVFLAREAIRNAYVKYLGVSGPNATRVGREVSIVAQRIPGIGAKARGKLSLNEFRAEVTRAQVTPSHMGTEGLIPEAIEAARVVNAGLVKIEGEARALGMFAGQKETRIAVARKRQRADGYRHEVEYLERNGDPMADEYRAAADRLMTEAEAMEAHAADTPTMPWKEERYFPRMWNVAAIEAERDRLHAILTDAYRRAGSGQPELSADNAIDLLLTEPTGAFSHAPGSPNSLRHREIPVLTHEVFDFIVQDPETVLNGYYRRMGAALEMTRTYGDAAGLDELDALRLDLKRRGVPDDKAQAALVRWMDVRDRIAGGFHGSSPLSLGNRTARALRNFASISVLGRVAISQLGDPMKAIMVQGLGLKRLLDPDAPAGMIQGLASLFDGSVHTFNVGGPAKLSGEAYELALARAASRFIEQDDATFVGKQTWVERKLAGLQAPFGVANLLAPITTLVKEATGMVAAHNVLKDAQLVAEGIQSGVEAKGHAAAMKRLARNGIDPLDAQLLATMPFEMSDRGLALANIEAWHGEQGERARKLMLGAVSGEIRRSVISPAPLERPRWFDGVVVTKGKMKKAFAEKDAAEARVDSARSAVRALAGRDEADPARVEAETILSEALAARYSARRNLGLKARKELPLLSLPAQLHSFAMSSGAKTLHGLFGAGDRNKMGGLMTMLVGGLIVARYKTSERKWQEMGWDERIYSAVDNSGLTSIFGDAFNAIDAGLNLGLVGKNERDPEGETIADEAGVFGGAATSSAINMMNMVAGVGDDDFETWKTMRRLPGFSILWVQYLMDNLVTTLSPSTDGDTHASAAPPADNAAMAEDPASPGTAVLDPHARLGAASGEPPAIDMGYLAQAKPDQQLDAASYLDNIDPETRARIMAKVKKGRGRKPRHPRQTRPTIAALL